MGGLSGMGETPMPRYAFAIASDLWGPALVSTMKFLLYHRICFRPPCKIDGQVQRPSNEVRS